MYTIKTSLSGVEFVVRQSDGAEIPFDPANTDYQQFKADVTAGAELLDADGVAMSATEAADFIKTLP